MEELVDMAKKFRDAAARGETLGLSEDEVRFYDALATNESAVRELSDETLKKIAHELTENLRQNLSVDWSARESVRAKLRLMVKDPLHNSLRSVVSRTRAVCCVVFLDNIRAIGCKKTPCSPSRSDRHILARVMQRVLKRILRKYKYPPDLEAAAVKLVLQQAEVMGRAWEA